MVLDFTVDGGVTLAFRQPRNTKKEKNSLCLSTGHILLHKALTRNENYENI